MAAKQNQRLVIGMMDGMGMPVYRASRMPGLLRGAPPELYRLFLDLA